MSAVVSEGTEGSMGLPEPPDPNILEVDPTCRYVRVMFCSLLSYQLMFQILLCLSIMVFLYLRFS